MTLNVKISGPNAKYYIFPIFRALCRTPQSILEETTVRVALICDRLTVEAVNHDFSLRTRIAHFADRDEEEGEVIFPAYHVVDFLDRKDEVPLSFKAILSPKCQRVSAVTVDWTKGRETVETLDKMTRILLDKGQRLCCLVYDVKRLVQAIGEAREDLIMVFDIEGGHIKNAVASRSDADFPLRRGNDEMLQGKVDKFAPLDCVGVIKLRREILHAVLQFLCPEAGAEFRCSYMEVYDNAIKLYSFGVGEMVIYNRDVV